VFALGVAACSGVKRIRGLSALTGAWFSRHRNPDFARGSDGERVSDETKKRTRFVRSA